LTLAVHKAMIPIRLDLDSRANTRFAPTAFESIHGSAPDIAGKNVINPTATLLSAAMMLDYLGFADAAQRLDGAISAVYAEGRYLTPDQGGKGLTTEFCQAVKRYL